MDRAPHVLLLQTAWALSTLGVIQQMPPRPRPIQAQVRFGGTAVTGGQRGLGSSSCSSPVPGGRPGASRRRWKGLQLRWRTQAAPGVGAGTWHGGPSRVPANVSLSLLRTPGPSLELLPWGLTSACLFHPGRKSSPEVLGGSLDEGGVRLSVTPALEQ